MVTATPDLQRRTGLRESWKRQKEQERADLLHDGEQIRSFLVFRTSVQPLVHRRVPQNDPHVVARLLIRNALDEELGVVESGALAPAADTPLTGVVGGERVGGVRVARQ